MENQRIELFETDLIGEQVMLAHGGGVYIGRLRGLTYRPYGGAFQLRLFALIELGNGRVVDEVVLYRGTASFGLYVLRENSLAWAMAEAKLKVYEMAAIIKLAAEPQWSHRAMLHQLQLWKTGVRDGLIHDEVLALLGGE